MKKTLLFCLSLLVLAAASPVGATEAEETTTYTNPIARPNITNVRLSQFSYKIMGGRIITGTVRGWNATAKTWFEPATSIKFQIGVNLSDGTVGTVFLGPGLRGQTPSGTKWLRKLDTDGDGNTNNDDQAGECDLDKADVKQYLIDAVNAGAADPLVRAFKEVTNQCLGGT